MVAKPVDTPVAKRVAKPVSAPSQTAVVKHPIVRINPKYTASVENAAKKRSADAINVEQKSGDVIAENDGSPIQAAKEIQAARETTIAQSVESKKVIIESFPAMTSRLKRKAVAVASLPVPIERTNADGTTAKPTVDTVTHDPSSVPTVVAKATRVERSTLEQLPKLPPAELNDVVDVVAQSAETANSGDTGSEAPHDHATAPHSVLKSDSVPANLVASKQNLRTAAKPTLSQSRDPIVLHLSHAQVRSMTIGGDLRGVTIGDKDICQAFESGANQIKLIGTGLGKTTLTIWADVASGEPTRTQSFEIEVSDGINATGDKVSEHTELLNESIDKAFPRASVVVSRRGGELNVTGRCDTEAEAKQIIRMVRKSCLVPVQDDLKVRQL